VDRGRPGLFRRMRVGQRPPWSEPFVSGCIRRATPTGTRIAPDNAQVRKDEHAPAVNWARSGIKTIKKGSYHGDSKSSKEPEDGGSGTRIETNLPTMGRGGGQKKVERQDRKKRI